MRAPRYTHTVTWPFCAPKGMVWDMHKFTLIDAILEARKALSFHGAQDGFSLYCGQVAFAVLRQLPQFIAGPGDDGPEAWLHIAVPGPVGRDELIEVEIVPDQSELSGLAMAREDGSRVRVVMLGVPPEFIELTLAQGFKF